jgi:hypothetical protein
VLDAVDVEQQLALEHIARLVVIGVEMKWRPLAAACGVLDQTDYSS